MKTHRASVAIVPPPSSWEPIEVIRRRHDPKIERWCPHVNLLYPFHDDVPEGRLAEVCAKVEPFQVELGKPSSFGHRGGRFTIWFSPEPADRVRALQATLMAAFPDCDDVARHHAGYTPHLSVGQAHGRTAADALLREIEDTFPGVAFDLTEIVLMKRGPDTPFAVAARIPLGGA